MANALTGDFDAVLEVSGGTLRRLVAGMHQNAFGDTSKPSVFHVVDFRLQGKHGLSGEHGTVSAQVGVPYLHLIHGATDRIRVEIGVRVRYHADPGSLPLADLIHGTVRADYLFADIDPHCLGWRGIASDYLWLRVIDDSVSFEGTCLNESSAVSIIALLNEATIKAHIARHIAELLGSNFAPQPLRVAKQFRRFRSLAPGDGPNQCAIAIPYGLDGGTPSGNLASISDLFLDGHDFGLAVGIDAILAKVRPMVDPLVGYQINIHHERDAGVGGGLILDYHIRVDAATVDWLGPIALPIVLPSGGLFRARVTGQGWASRLYRSGVYNVGSVSASDLRSTFTVDQFVSLTFEAGAEQLHVAAFGPPVVHVDYNGPFGDVVKSMAESKLSGQIKGPLNNALAQAQSQLNAVPLSEARASIATEVQRVADDGGAHYDRALFRMDGIVLCGTITVRHRYAPQVVFHKTAALDGFDAIDSWIPGGRVDTFEWRWRWFTNPVATPLGPPGTATEEDRFTLKRPSGGFSKFGLAVAVEKPLPGLDGWGEMCLTISGVHVDHVTGALVRVTSQKSCGQFGSQFRMPYEVNGPYLRVCDPLHPREHLSPEIGVVQAGIGETGEGASNTLVVYLHDRWNEEAVAALTRGLESCRRQGCGLLVVLLFKDGALAAADHGLRARLDDIARTLPAMTLVTEDVRGGWTRAMAFPEQQVGVSWRLVSPEGLIRWSHDGPAEYDLVARALETRLEPSHPPGLVQTRSEVAIGAHVPIQIFSDPCPPAPLGRQGFADTKVVFVYKDGASTRAQLQRLARRDERGAGEDGLVVLVVDGATPREVEALRAEFALDLVMLPDPHGAYTRRAGVRFSPTTLHVDAWGRLSERRIGVN